MTSTIRNAALAALLASTTFAASSAPVSAQERGIELGFLDCLVEGGAGFIIGSTKDVACTYTPSDARFGPEPYFGVINRWGLDVGVTGTAVMQWVVLAPSDNIYAPGALAGDYVGASADASVAIGAGANLLVGGGQNSFTLQPLSVQAQTGVNVAIGVSELQLRSSE